MSATGGMCGWRPQVGRGCGDPGVCESGGGCVGCDERVGAGCAQWGGGWLHLLHCCQAPASLVSPTHAPSLEAEPSIPGPCFQAQSRAFIICASCTPSLGHTLLLVTIPVVQVLTGCGQQLQHRRCWPLGAASLGCVPSPGATCPQPSPQGEGRPLTPAPSQPC